MTDKYYLSANDYLHDIWRLAHSILKSGWKPEVILALWRGGAEPGVAIHEYFAACGHKLRHAPVKCYSYTGIGKSETTVSFEFADNIFAALAPKTKVLVVDDVFDSGRTAAAVRERIEALGCEMRMACVYWKPTMNVTPYTPEYYTRTVDQWLVFPHEIEGLTPEEIRKKDPILAELMADN